MCRRWPVKTLARAAAPAWGRPGTGKPVCEALPGRVLCSCPSSAAALAAAAAACTASALLGRLAGLWGPERWALWGNLNR